MACHTHSTDYRSHYKDATNDQGYNKVLDTYDLEQLQEIASHGCQSGVCSEHIYYADTISFYEKHEREILDHLISINGVEFLGNVLVEHQGCYDAYRNDLTWAFIESVAQDACIKMEEDQDE